MTIKDKAKKAAGRARCTKCKFWINGICTETFEEKSWKPNEEQMRAFSAMIKFVEIATSFDAYKQRQVESLYQELSKLVLK